MRHARFPAEGLYGLAALAAAAIAYGAASAAHGSGFLAVFIVGILLGAERTPHKGEIERFSTALASFLEMAVFAALGLTIDFGILGERVIWRDGLLLALLLIFVVRPVVVLPLLARLRMRWGERLFIAWAGVKGAAPILLAALAVLGGFESTRMYGIVFVVVLFSVVVQGGSVRLLAVWLAIPKPREAPRAVSAARRYRVSEGSRAAGSTVRDLPIGSRGWVTLIGRNGDHRRPRGRDVIRAGDDVFVNSDDDARARRLRRLFEEPRDRSKGLDLQSLVPMNQRESSTGNGNADEEHKLPADAGRA
jgi:cell volume regulation protein A